MHKLKHNKHNQADERVYRVRPLVLPEEKASLLAPWTYKNPEVVYNEVIEDDQDADTEEE